MSNRSSRTENTLKNVIASTMTMLLTTVLQFACRKVFIASLGNDYLSFDGLFTNILTMLSLAELGFGESVIFCLYKPLAVIDAHQVKALINYYAKVYRIVAIVILMLGFAVIPLFPYLMKNPPEVAESLYLIYVLFLINTVTSYLWVYKQSILIADQKNYIVYNVKLVVSIITMAAQIIFLLLTHNYIVYLLLTIATTFATNLYVSRVADKHYPYLRKRDKTVLDTETRKTINTNVRALMIYKVGTMLVTGVDNLMISSLIGVTLVGIYSNYSLVVNRASQIFRSVVAATTGSVGNLNATESAAYSESIGRVLLFVTFWIFGFAAVGMFILVNPFIVFLAGKEFLFDHWTVLFIVLDFYLLGANSPMNVYRNAMGLYRYGKYRPMFCAIANLIVSLALVKPLGVLGIVLGTFAARLGVTSWYEPFIVYKHGLHMSAKKYLIRYAAYLTIIIGLCGVCYAACLPFSSFTLLNFVIKIIIVSVITNLCFYLLFKNTDEFRYMKQLVSRFMKKFTKKG